MKLVGMTSLSNTPIIGKTSILTRLRIDMIFSERLELKYTCLEDALFLLELINTPGWLEFIGDKNIRDLKACQQWIEDSIIEQHTRLGYTALTVQLKEDDTPIGIISLVKRDALEHVDIGYAFLPEHTGKGYAYEATKAGLEFLIEVHNKETVLAIVQSNNPRSIKLLGKLNFIHEGLKNINDESLEVYSYSV